MFFVVKRRFRMEFRDGREWISEGECIVVPRMVEHRPVEESHARFFESAASEVNPGNGTGELAAELERI